MKLSVGERLAILSVLPKEGDITTLRIVRDLQMALGFDEEEHRRLSLKVNGAQVTWNAEVDPNKDVPIGPRAFAAIRDAFGFLDKQKKLMLPHLPVYERFLEEDDERVVKMR